MPRVELTFNNNIAACLECRCVRRNACQRYWLGQQPGQTYYALFPYRNCPDFLEKHRHELH
ncbi:MAG: hypothetical protein DDT26_00224 [Dehalococcoidia bacterium]|nr:hypothetical protein [Chloroflexota bacterium]